MSEARPLTTSALIAMIPNAHRFAAACTGLLFFVLLFSGCSADPLEENTERFEALVEVLEANKHDDDKLLEALDTFVAEEKGNFASDRKALEALSEDELNTLRAKHEKRLRAALERLFDVTLEIQDRLRVHPQKQLRFIALLETLGHAP